ASLADALVARAPAPPPGRPEATDRVARDVLDGADLGAREPSATKSRSARGQHQLRGGKAAVGKERDEAAKDRAGRPSIELLVRDGARKRLVRGAAGGREVAG